MTPCGSRPPSPGSRRSSPRCNPEATADQLRSIAFGRLARPAELLALLLEHRDEPEELDLD